jgi:hypothetical protein
MVKKLILITFLILLAIPLTGHANDSNDASKILNKYLNDERTYYKDHSVELSDTVVFEAKVTENGKTDTRKVMAIFAKSKDVRDTIFYFDVSAIYFYDMDNQKILDPTASIDNKQATNFSDHYLNQSGNHITVFSLIVLMFSLFLGLFVIPPLSVVFYKHA